MKKMILAGLFSIFLTSLLWAYPVQATRPAASTRTATPTPRSRPTRTRTPLPSLLTILPGQLSFGFGGGGYPGGILDECFGFLRTYRGVYPVAFVGERNLNWQRPEMAPLCIAGFPMNGILRIKLATTAGKTIGSGVFESGVPNKGWDTLPIRQTRPVMYDDAGLSGWDKNDLPLILIYIWLPPDFPYTQLRIDASNDGGKFAGIIKGVTWDDDNPYVYVPKTNLDPFNYSDESVGYSLGVGQQLIIQGINFAKNTSLPVGVYRGTYEELQFYNWIPSDSQGRISISLHFGSSSPPDYYTLAVFSNPPRIHQGEFIDIFANICLGAPASHLSVGDQVIINWEIPKSNNIYSRAGLKGSVVGIFKSGQTADVIDGWRCVDQMVWWKIHTSAGVEGWTSEGKGDEYWVVPAPVTPMP